MSPLLLRSCTLRFRPVLCEAEAKTPSCDFRWFRFKTCSCEKCGKSRGRFALFRFLLCISRMFFILADLILLALAILLTATIRPGFPHLPSCQEIPYSPPGAFLRSAPRFQVSHRFSVQTPSPHKSPHSCLCVVS